MSIWFRRSTNWDSKRDSTSSKSSFFISAINEAAFILKTRYFFCQNARFSELWAYIFCWTWEGFDWFISGSIKYLMSEQVSADVNCSFRKMYNYLVRFHHQEIKDLCHNRFITIYRFKITLIWDISIIHFGNNIKYIIFI